MQNYHDIDYGLRAKRMDGDRVYVSNGSFFLIFGTDLVLEDGDRFLVRFIEAGRRVAANFFRLDRLMAA